MTMPVPVVTLKQYWLKNWQTVTPAALQSGGTNPFTVTPGSTLLAVWVGYDNGRILPPIDSIGKYTIPVGTSPAYAYDGAHLVLSAALMPNAVGGTHTTIPQVITANTGGQDGEVGLWIFEITNMPANAVVRYCNASLVVSSSQSWSFASDSSPQVGDLAIAITTYENSVQLASAGLTDPPTGWTSILVDQDASTMMPTEGCMQIVGTAGAVTANWANSDTTTTEHFSIMLVLAPAATSLVMSTQPQSTTTSAGMFADFSCVVTGATGTPHYQWTVNGVNVGSDSANLSYQAASSESQSLVNVTVTDDLGSIQAVAPAKLRVYKSRSRPLRRAETANYDNSGVDLLPATYLGASQFDPSIIKPASGSTGINASVSLTESADTVSTGLTVAVASSLAVTEAADTASSSLSEVVSVTEASTESPDTVATAVSVAIATTTAVSESADTITAAIAVAEATSLSASEGADTVSFAATVVASASLSITESPDTSVEQTTVAEVATASLTESADTVSGAAVVAVTATSSLTEAADTVSSTLSSQNGLNASLVATESPDTLATTASVAVSLNGAISESAETVSSSAATAVSASFAATESPDTLDSSVGYAHVNISFAVTESPDTATAQDSVLVTTYVASATEAPDIVSSNATVIAIISAALSESQDTVTSSFVLPVGTASALIEIGDAANASTFLLVTSTSALTEVGDVCSAHSTSVTTITDPRLIYTDPGLRAYVEPSLYYA